MQMPVSKKGNNSTENLRNRFKSNQFIYTLVCTYMPNIRILAKAVPQIFCSQGCYYTKCLCRKKGSNSTENLWNRIKIKSVHQHFGLYHMPNIRILAKAVLQIFCSQGCSYTKCLCPKKGNNSTEYLRNRLKI